MTKKQLLKDLGKGKYLLMLYKLNEEGGLEEKSLIIDDSAFSEPHSQYVMKMLNE